MRVTITEGINTKDVTDFVVGEVRVESHRVGTATICTFNLLRENLDFSFYEGAKVTISKNGNIMFVGYVFGKKRNSQQIIEICCYDILRYLKNRDSFIFINRKASDIIKQIANTYRIPLGDIEDTSLVISQGIFDNKELISIIYELLNKTFEYTGKLYVLFDNCGKLELKSVENMYKPFMFIKDEGSVIDFTYTTDIGEDTYNAIKIQRGTKKKGYETLLTVKDDENINKWGLLQYYDKADDEQTIEEIKKIAQNILKNKNRVRRDISVDIIIEKGEEIIRAGNVIQVYIDDIGDRGLTTPMLIDKCTHIISKSEHRASIEFTDFTVEDKY